jgi:hypothetical protein
MSLTVHRRRSNIIDVRPTIPLATGKAPKGAEDRPSTKRRRGAGGEPSPSTPIFIARSTMNHLEEPKLPSIKLIHAIGIVWVSMWAAFLLTLLTRHGE